MSVGDSIMRGLQEAIDAQHIVDNYHCSSYNDETGIWKLTFSNACGVPIKIRLKEEALSQMMLDIGKMYYERTGYRMFDVDEEDK